MSEHSDQPSVMTLLPAGTIIQAPDDIGRVIFMFRKMDDAIIFFEYWREVTKAGEQPERCPRCGSEDPAMIGDMRHGVFICPDTWHTSAPPEPTCRKCGKDIDVGDCVAVYAGLSKPTLRTKIGYECIECAPAPASAPPADIGEHCAENQNLAMQTINAPPAQIQVDPSIWKWPASPATQSADQSLTNAINRELSSLREWANRAEKENAALRAELERLRAALVKFGTHAYGCNQNLCWHAEHDATCCDCGLTKVLGEAKGDQGQKAELERLRAAQEELELVADNLADYARKYFDSFDLYLHSWLRHIGGVIRPKHHQIDGFAMRTEDIYKKAQLVDRIKKILCDELKKEASTKDAMFDAVFRFLAEDGHDKVPTN